MAREAEEHLRFVREILRRPMEAEWARGGLTGPQRSVMHAVVHSDGLSLKELSRRVGLAHSTVSGIVGRLELRGLLERRVSETDARVTLILPGKLVLDYLRNRLPKIAILPLVKSLEKARPEERDAILHGLRTLRRVIEEK